jgi:hypothetical protein
MHRHTRLQIRVCRESARLIPMPASKQGTRAQIRHSAKSVTHNNGGDADDKSFANMTKKHWQALSAFLITRKDRPGPGLSPNALCIPGAPRARRRIGSTLLHAQNELSFVRRSFRRRRVVKLIPVVPATELGFKVQTRGVACLVKESSAACAYM